MGLNNYANIADQATSTIEANVIAKNVNRVNKTAVGSDLDAVRAELVDAETQARVTGIVIADLTVATGGAISATLTFSKNVTIGAGATILAKIDGGATTRTLTCSGVTNQTTAAFAGTAQGSAGTLDLFAQTISGTITDVADGHAVDKVITSDVAEAADQIVVS